jgi:hypothetical protein
MLDLLLRAPARLKAPFEHPREAVEFALLPLRPSDVREELPLELSLGLPHRERELHVQVVVCGSVRCFAAREPVEERAARHAELGGDALVREPVGDERPDR